MLALKYLLVAVLVWGGIALTYASIVMAPWRWTRDTRQPLSEAFRAFRRPA